MFQFELAADPSLPDVSGHPDAVFRAIVNVLKNAGVAPPWIEADKEVRVLLARRDAILARAADGPAPAELGRRRDRAALEEIVIAVGKAVARLNAEAPTDRQQRRPLVLADELARYEAACRR